MAYLQFHRKEGRMRRGDYITIAKNGTFRVSSDCYEKYFIGFKSVMFYYDKDRKSIGIKPMEEASADSYDIRVTTRENSKSVTITGISFLKYFGVDYSKTSKYEPKWNDEEKLLEIDLV
ncbi:hypothetical protein HQ584_05150 [Patescibacteria group bacterium]|nr:hypothetical protein [Patescibacteria group bacterium]